jgi:hypothetical protein
MLSGSFAPVCCGGKMHLVARATKGVVSSFCGANVDSGANAEASEATGAWISVLGNLRISIWINGTAIIWPIAGLNGYNS